MNSKESGGADSEDCPQEDDYLDHPHGGLWLCWSVQVHGSVFLQQITSLISATDTWEPAGSWSSW